MKNGARVQNSMVHRVTAKPFTSRISANSTYYDPNPRIFFFVLTKNVQIPNFLAGNSSRNTKLRIIILLYMRLQDLSLSFTYEKKNEISVSVINMPINSTWIPSFKLRIYYINIYHQLHQMLKFSLRMI